MKQKTHPPYTFDGKNIRCYLTEKPILDNYDELYLRRAHGQYWNDYIHDNYKDRLEEWRQSKITVPVSEDDISELNDYVYKTSTVRNWFDKESDISELADRIVIKDNIAKLLPIKEQFKIDSRDINLPDIEDVQYDTDVKLYTKRELILKLQDCALHFGIINPSKDDGTILEKINNYIIKIL